MTETYPDPLAIVAAYLIAANVVSTRVYIDTAPKGVESQSYIVVKGGNGVYLRPSAAGSFRVQLDCYGSGASTALARQVVIGAIQAMNDACNTATSSGTLIAAAQQGGGSAILVPPGVRPFIPVYFNVTVKP